MRRSGARPGREPSAPDRGATPERDRALRPIAQAEPGTVLNTTGASSHSTAPPSAGSATPRPAPRLPSREPRDLAERGLSTWCSTATASRTTLLRHRPTAPKGAPPLATQTSTEEAACERPANRPQLGTSEPCRSARSPRCRPTRPVAGRGRSGRQSARTQPTGSSAPSRARYGERAAARRAEGQTPARPPRGRRGHRDRRSPKIDWDQAELNTLVAAIRAEDGDPAEYVDMIFRVPERKYVAWPPHPQRLRAGAHGEAGARYRLVLGEFALMVAASIDDGGAPHPDPRNGTALASRARPSVQPYLSSLQPAPQAAGRRLARQYGGRADGDSLASPEADHHAHPAAHPDSRRRRRRQDQSPSGEVRPAGDHRDR